MIADLHCDLLLYLEGDKNRSAYDKLPRCSIEQMLQGEVCLQILPIFTKTKVGSSERGLRQNEIFHSLPLQYPEAIHSLSEPVNFHGKSKKISIVRAIENASSFCEEFEPLKIGLQRLENLLHQGSLFYMSLTWNTENRFGGGTNTAVGIKNDGKSVLSFLDGKHVAIDLSHTSDRLAYDIIDYVDQKNLRIPLLASHSNCRSVCPEPRNLPDGIIQEIYKRSGLVGINFIKPFLGPSSHYIIGHLAHYLQLGGENATCFGADFFYEQDLPLDKQRPPGSYFYEEFGNSSTYGHILTLWEKELSLSPETRKKLASGNVESFYLRNIRPLA